MASHPHDAISPVGTKKRATHAHRSQAFLLRISQKTSAWSVSALLNSLLFPSDAQLHPQQQASPKTFTSTHREKAFQAQLFK